MHDARLLAAVQQAEGVAIAVETIERLAQVSGLRGFAIQGSGNDEVALEVIAQSGMGVA